LYGIVPIVNTPFDEQLHIDVPSLERMLEQNIADGISGCIVPAVASEVEKLSMEERKAFIETVKRICGERIQVVAGASSEVLEETLEIARHAVRVGCSGVLCRVPNRLTRADPRSIFEYFSQVGGAGMEMLMIQDLDWAGPGLPVDLIAEMFERIPAFRCLKVETVPAGVKYTQVLEATHGALNVSGGWAITQMIEALDRGVHAFNPTAITIPFVQIYRRYHEGRRDEARALFDRFVPTLAWTHQHIDISIQFLKRYCHRRGWFSTTNVRPPMIPYDCYHERCGAEYIEQVLRLESELRGEQ
jgi:4-hydroxy-tetrahydrodipicolinate synthase